MNEKLLIGKRVIVQGITGSQGAFHTREMVKSGVTIIAGTSPTKAGSLLDTIPVYKSISEIQENTAIDTSIMFVPAVAAKGAIIEAIHAKIPLIICITEGIPIHDMLQIKQHLQQGSSRLIGPNCPGILLPGVTKLGIIPTHFGLPGTTAVVSRSGTLTYEVIAGLTQAGIGQKYVIGIGGDRITGTGFIDCLKLFEDDPEIENIVLIGEIGGNSELLAADFIQKHVTKPVYTYITGHHAPEGVQLGHAGAILGSKSESAAAKTAYLARRGVKTSTNLSNLVRLLTD